jgi:autotransporter-associated beta strand protein
MRSNQSGKRVHHARNIPVEAQKGRQLRLRSTATLLAAAIASVIPAHLTKAANTEYDVNSGSTDLTAAASYTTGGTAGTGAGGTTAGSAPSVTSDVTFDSGIIYSPAAFTINGTSLTFGSLNDLATNALTIANTGSAAETLTLGGGSDPGSSVPGASSGDLIYVGSTGTLNLAAGTGNTALGLVLGQSGNFDVAGNAVINSIVSGSFALTKTGAGTLTLSGVNTFSGGLTISNGILATAANTTLGGATGTAGAVSVNGGTLEYTNTTALTNTHAITIGASGGTFLIAGTATSGQNSRVIFNTANDLLGSGALTVTGPAGNTLGGTGANGSTNGGAGVLVLNQADTYSGDITMQSGGLLELGSATALGSTATITLGNQAEVSDDGKAITNNIIVSGGNNSVIGFNRSGGNYSGAVTLNANATIGLREWYSYGTAQSGTISGVISDGGAGYGLTLSSGTTTGGTLTLTNVDTYQGATTINHNTLALGAGGSVANSAITVNNFGALTVGSATGTATRGGNVTLNGSSMTDTGVASTTTNDEFGAFSLSGFNGLTLTPNATGQAALTFSSIGTRAANSVVALSGTYGGTPGVNNTTLLFTTAAFRLQFHWRRGRAGNQHVEHYSLDGQRWQRALHL